MHSKLTCKNALALVSSPAKLHDEKSVKKFGPGWNNCSPSLQSSIGRQKSVPEGREAQKDLDRKGPIDGPGLLQPRMEDRQVENNPGLDL